MKTRNFDSGASCRQMLPTRILITAKVPVVPHPASKSQRFGLNPRTPSGSQGCYPTPGERSPRPPRLPSSIATHIEPCSTPFLVLSSYCILLSIMCTFLPKFLRMCIIRGQYLKYLVPVLVFCNYLLHKISCTIICSKINAKIPL